MSDALLLQLFWLAMALVVLVLCVAAVIFLYAMLDYPLWQGAGKRLRRGTGHADSQGSSKQTPLQQDPWQASADRMIVPLPRADDLPLHRDDLTDDLDDDD